MAGNQHLFSEFTRIKDYFCRFLLSRNLTDDKNVKMTINRLIEKKKSVKINENKEKWRGKQEIILRDIPRKRLSTNWGKETEV